MPDRLPALRHRRRPQGRHHRPARRPGDPSAAVPVAGEGAEVLPDRRPAAPARPAAGPGDAHSAQEWIWRREEYHALFDAAPAGSRPRREHALLPPRPRRRTRRLVADVPDVKVIVVVRDPVDRAYSNWAHLRADGLEPEADFAAAAPAEQRADRRRLGAVLALPRAGPVRRAAARPLPARAPGAGAPAPLPAARRHPARDAGPGQRLPRRGHRPGAHRRSGERQAVRRGHRPLPPAVPGRAGRGGARAPTSRRRCGARRAAR